MKYYSTRDKSTKVSFREAVLTGIPLDKGLYFPETIPSLETEFIEELSNLSNEEIAFECISKFSGKDIDEASLKRIVSETINFKFLQIWVGNIASYEFYFFCFVLCSNLSFID